jgi:PAS domain S-box-containing protein
LKRPCCRPAKQTYRTLFETVPHGIVYHDARGLITSANPAAQRILGLTLDAAAGPQRRSTRAGRPSTRTAAPFPASSTRRCRRWHFGQPVNDVVMGVQVPGRGRVWLLVDATPLFKHGRARVGLRQRSRTSPSVCS